MRTWQAILVGSLLLAFVAAIVSPADWYRSAEGEVAVSIALDRKACSDPRLPYEITVKNGSSKTVKRVTYRVELFERGDSKQLAAETQPPWTFVIEPGETTKGCYRIEREWNTPSPTDPVVTIKVEKVEFFADGETIPR